MHGARVIALRGNFDEALALVRELAERHPIALVNSVNEFRLEGQKTAAFEIVEELGGELDALCIPVGNAGNITAYWKGFEEAGVRPRMLGLQAEGAAPLVHGAPVEQPETVASAIRIGNPARWEEAMGAMAASHGAIRAVSDAEILDAYRFLAAHEGVFCEPASAAGVAGPAQARGGGRPAGRLRAHRPRAQGPADRARARRLRRAVRARPRGRRARRPGLSACGAGSSAFPPPRPTSARASTCSPARSACTWSSRWSRPGASPWRPTWRSPATAATSRCALRAAAPGRRARVPDPLRHPALGRAGDERRRDRRRAARRRLDVRARRRPARATRRELEGHPDNVAAALLGGFVLCADGRAERFDVPAGLEAVLVVPHEAVRTAAARAALPAEVPMADAVFNVAHTGLLVLGLTRGDWDLVARGLDDRLHQPRRAHLYPRSMALVRRGARRSARSARRSPAPARPCSSGAPTRRPARCSAGWRRSARAGPTSATCRSSRAARTSSS